MRAVVFVFLAILGVFQAAGAASPQRGEFNQIGNYKVSCGTVTAASDARKSGYHAWVAGFVSGAGYGYSMHGARLADTDFDGASKWIDKYCADHPLDELADAAVALVQELIQRRH